MNVQSARIVKEGKVLFVPWCIILMFCAAPFLKIFRTPDLFYSFPIRGPFATAGFIDAIFQIGLLAGIPLLACLSFGSEFRSRTMELLLSQPLGRMQIWREKFVMASLATLTLVLVAAASQHAPLGALGAAGDSVLLFLFATTCAAAFWTLLARSTIGGYALNIAAFILLFGWIAGRAHAVSLQTETIVFLLYGAVMYWAGRRMFGRFQVAGSLANADMMTILPAWTLKDTRTVFRCQPRQPVLNLIRKELYFLRPLGFISILYVFVWIVLAISLSSMAPATGAMTASVTTIVLVTGSYPVIAMFLAASLPMAEEHASGVRSWHLTLPIAVRRQWLIRLFTAACGGLLYATAVPALLRAVGWFALRPEFAAQAERLSISEPAWELLVLFLFIFWCASVTHDMTRTVIFAVASLGLLGVAAEAGVWMAVPLMDPIGKLFVTIISWRQLDPFYFSRFLGMRYDVFHPAGPDWLEAGLIMAAMLVHSYRLFRRTAAETALKAGRVLLPFVLGLFILNCATAIRRQAAAQLVPAVNLIDDVEKSVVRFQPDISRLGTQPVAFTVEDLAKASALSYQTQRWLRNATMTVSLSDVHTYNPGQFRPGNNSKTYLVHIHLPSGTECRLSFLDRDPSRLWSIPLLTSCK